MKKRKLYSGAKPTTDDFAAYLTATKRDKGAPHARAFFTLQELLAFVRQRAGAYYPLVTRPFVANWLRRNGYHSREVWQPGLHLRFWTPLQTQAELLAALKKANFHYGVRSDIVPK